jgi:hypothetical protein
MSNPLPGRNDLCHCGSGKKYKHCCLAKDEAAERQKRAAAEKTAPAAETTPAAEGATGGEAAPERTRPPKHATQQPWKRAENRGFPKLNVPRRIGGS